MRKAQKQQILDIVKTLYEAHEIIKKFIQSNQIEQIFNLLVDCQNTAVQLGEIIEKSEGENFTTVTYLEHYCEELYNIGLSLNEENEINANNIVKRLDKSLIAVENSVKFDIKVKYEILFMPYKASMWDSLESIWKAADADENCDAYVMPIPYYDRKKDFSLGEYHYEGLQFPDYVPIVSSYDLEKRKPDVIYIHNPYDGGNLVTSVDPKYYSNELKKYTECLVYVPYFSMFQGSGKYESVCPVYNNMDYIVMQSKSCRTSFDENIPNSKILYLGSPKFDRIINMCKNPQSAPLDWKIKMMGKKVYFYNTSITGMLQNTEVFLKKMQYVFKCFVGRQDACLLWRPHPLLESTFESMRPKYLDMYRKLKQFFIDKNLGIYDDTPDMDKSIALSDVYIGDSGSSVVSIFAMACKPIFLLNNEINTLPTHKDKIASVIDWFDIYSNNRYYVVGGNQLLYSENNDYNYKYLCELSDKDLDYGNLSISIDNRTYILPANTQEIAVIENGELKKIKLKQTEDKMQSFMYMFNIGKYLLLIPNKYPKLVRYNTETGEIKYFDINKDVYLNEVNGQVAWGLVAKYKDLLLLPSPKDNKVLAFDVNTGKQNIYTVGNENCTGTLCILFDGQDFWLMPFKGYNVRRWNIETGDVTTYNCKLDGIACTNFTSIEHYLCDERPFGYPAFTDGYVYLSAFWSNKFVKLNRNTGEMCEFIPNIDILDKPINIYHKVYARFTFLSKVCEDIYLMFSYFNKTLYKINLKENTSQKINYNIDEYSLSCIEKGFSLHKYGDWKTYSCNENAFNSLQDLLDDNIIGNKFDKEEQLKLNNEIAVNIDGTCGEKIHKAIIEKIDR